MVQLESRGSCPLGGGGGGEGVLPYKLNGDVRPARVCFSGFLS